MVASDSLHAIAELEVVREGYVVRRARLPEKRWHTLRHTFGTHTALFGVNPWRLQSWMGHKRIDETMIYVHVAENHRRDIPEPILGAAETERDPDRRIILMLGARGSHVAADQTPEMKKAAKTAA